MPSNDSQPSPGSRGHGIRGHLRLVCGPDSRGLPILREQSFRAPIHLSKPHLDAETLVLNVVNPTAGMLEDDRIEQDVTVENGGRLLLTSPSASRAHRVRNGWAELSQTYRVKSGGFLEVLPEMLIPQAGAIYRQNTTLEVEGGGELLFFESLAPGRVASGEIFQYTRLDWLTELFMGGRRVLRERYRIEPGSESIEALQQLFPAAYYGSVLVVSPRVETESACWEAVRGLQNTGLWIGQSPLDHPNTFIVKWISGDAMGVRRAQNAVRAALYGQISKQTPDLRRVTGR